MPGIGEVIEGAVQQAPQCGRQSIGGSLRRGGARGDGKVRQRFRKPASGFFAFFGGFPAF